ncbi:DUF2169 domain-containing protein [Pseudoduganella ginsengisoli]|uniref:DUF2169 family type VI secretion system accessory protein n=1 Tax=Pseudoduganella ginsengisoli TaxID=1462440 RepID=UPI0014781871
MEIPAIPSLRFDNRTGFDALHFDTLDQNGVAFHVITAKTGYTLSPGATPGQAYLTPAAALLHVADVHYEDNLDRSVRYESDLAPYKPLCDVVVIGAAYPPQGGKRPSFDIALRVQRPDLPPALPERPRPLNPWQPLSPEVYQQWQKDLACAAPRPGALLVDKTLRIHGERHLHRLAAPLRWVHGTPWRLDSAAACTPLPLRYEYAFGGECRAEASDAWAANIPASHRLTPEQQASYPDTAPAPVAHDSCQSNPVGCGFTRDWFALACGMETLPAPRIEYPVQPLTARAFWDAACGKHTIPAAGMGFVGRGWLPRRNLIGQVELKTTWHEDEVPLLPKDFDFRYWNGAPDDQQCPHLEGGERFTLTNLCPAGAPYAVTGADGNRTFTFALPQQALFILAAGADGVLAAQPLAIDTVVIDLDNGAVELTWRLALLADGTFDEVRLHHAGTPEALARLNELTSAAALS